MYRKSFRNTSIEKVTFIKNNFRTSLPYNYRLKIFKNHIYDNLITLLKQENQETLSVGESKMTFLMKIVLAGDGGVGKTAIRERYLGRGFQSKYMMTIGADFALKESVITGRSIKFQIWDLAGQQRFGAVRSVYYLGCLGALLLFDVTRRESFENLQNWIKEIWNNNGKGIIPIVVLGNKVDLRDQYPDNISNEVAKRYCAKLTEQTKSHGFDIQFMETSAKNGLNVGEAFDKLGKVYFDYIEQQKSKAKANK